MASEEITSREGAKRGAVLQFEVDLRRWGNTAGEDYSANTVGEKPRERLRHMVRTAAADTLRNGGTFVLVVTADKVTLIQRPDAEDLDDPTVTNGDRGSAAE